MTNDLPQSENDEVAPVSCEMVADYACEVGENPLWHPTEQRLYWTDIPAGRLYRYDPRTGHHAPCYQGRVVGGFTVQADDSLLLFLDRGTVATWRDGVFTEIIPELPQERLSRFNDVIADPQGRVFCGTMSTSQSKGRLYRLDRDGSCHRLLEDVGCSNGMAFAPDGKTFYFTDSFAYEIYAFDYDVETGGIANRRVFVRFTEADGMPDGMTIDAEGRFWVAFWGGNCILRLAPNGRVEEKIPIPAAKTSSLTFGGPDYRDAYVTTAGGENRTENGPFAGALFRLRNLAQGVPEFRSQIQTTPP